MNEKVRERMRDGVGVRGEIRKEILKLPLGPSLALMFILVLNSHDSPNFGPNSFSCPKITLTLPYSFKLVPMD